MAIGEAFMATTKEEYRLESSRGALWNWISRG